MPGFTHVTSETPHNTLQTDCLTLNPVSFPEDTWSTPTPSGCLTLGDLALPVSHSDGEKDKPAPVNPSERLRHSLPSPL